MSEAKPWTLCRDRLPREHEEHVRRPCLINMWRGASDARSLSLQKAFAASQAETNGSDGLHLPPRASFEVRDDLETVQKRLANARISSTYLQPKTSVLANVADFRRQSLPPELLAYEEWRVGTRACGNLQNMLNGVFQRGGAHAGILCAATISMRQSEFGGNQNCTQGQTLGSVPRLRWCAHAGFLGHSRHLKCWIMEAIAALLALKSRWRMHRCDSMHFACLPMHQGFGLVLTHFMSWCVLL